MPWHENLTWVYKQNKYGRRQSWNTGRVWGRVNSKISFYLRIVQQQIIDVNDTLLFLQVNCVETWIKFISEYEGTCMLCEENMVDVSPTTVRQWLFLSLKHDINVEFCQGLKKIPLSCTTCSLYFFSYAVTCGWYYIHFIIFLLPRKYCRILKYVSLNISVTFSHHVNTKTLTNCWLTLTAILLLYKLNLHKLLNGLIFADD